MPSSLFNPIPGLSVTDFDTLAELNAILTDATLDDISGARTPTVHSLGGAEHSATTLAGLNALVSDATLIDTLDARLSDDRFPLAHSHAASDITAGTFDPGSFSFLGSTIDALDALTVDNISVDGNTITTTSGDLILDATDFIKPKTTLLFDGTGATDRGIQFDRPDTSTPSNIRWTEAGNERWSFGVNVGTQDYLINNSNSTGNLLLRPLGTTIADGKIAGNVTFRVKAPVSVSTDVLQITDSAAAVKARWDSAFNLDLTDHYLELDEISTPANPAAGTRRMFVDQATGKLSVRTSAGNTVSLEAGGIATESSIQEINDTANTSSFTTMGMVFVYDGTNNMEAIVAAKMIASKGGAGTDYDLRLQDVTNGLTIATVINQTNTVDAIIDLGAISNLPTGPAIFEWQGLATGAATVTAQTGFLRLGS